MLCEKCGKNTANVYLKQNINGNMAESRLCSSCAGELSLFKNDFESDIFSMLNFNRTLYPAVEKKVCPMCGLSFADISKSGKAGCGECYETFKNELKPSVIRIHGTANHTGKIPKNRSLQISAKRKIEELNIKLRKMIDEQNFEEAALIRDEINKISREIQENKGGADI